MPSSSWLPAVGSVWSDIVSLSAFAYRDAEHVAVFRRRQHWFEPMPVSLALWWVSKGHRPGVEERMRRIAILAEREPSPEAFSFKSLRPTPC